MAKLIVPVDMTSENVGRPSAQQITALCETTKALAYYQILGKEHMVKLVDKLSATSPAPPFPNDSEKFSYDRGIRDNRHVAWEPNGMWQFQRGEYLFITPQRLK